MTDSEWVELVRFQNAEGAWLDGCLTRGENFGSERATVVLLHGKGGNFYSGLSRFLPPLLKPHGIDSLTINMRSHDLAYSRRGGADAPGAPLRADGGMWERLSKGHLDVQAAVEVAHDLTSAPVIVLGHSSGGYYAVEFLAHHHPEPAGVILLSPIMTNRTSFRMWFADAEEEAEMVRWAEKLVGEGRPDALMPLSDWYYGIGAGSLLERANDDGTSWGQALRDMTCPLLFVWGTLEDRAESWASAFADAGSLRKFSLAIEGGDHFYTGHFEQVASEVAMFIQSVVSS